MQGGAFAAMVVISTVLWGVVPLLEARMLGVHLASLFLVVCAVVLLTAVPLLLALYWDTVRVEVPALFTHHRRLMWYGLAAFGLNAAATTAYLLSLRNPAAPGRVSLVAVVATCCYPAVTALAVWALYGQRLRASAWAGLLLVAAGLGLVVLGSSTGPGPGR